ncbi:MAG: amidohydrolase, partial [Planctomycetes bacterium]|nr:amidohydrolase [Planctomycetota bacterium]
ETPEQLQKLVADYAAAHPDDAWIRGWGWNAGVFGEKNLTREVLDAAVPDRPVAIWASDGHNAAVNSKAIALSGLDKENADPANGHFVRDGDGRVTGLLYEAATQWMNARMPKQGDAHYAAGVRYGQEQCNRHGITGVLDALVQERHMRVYRDLADAGALTIRVAATALVVPEDTVEGALERVSMLRRDYARDMVAVHSAKFFLDGVMENRTGLMIEPYSDTGENAELMFDRAHLEKLFVAFDAARFQLHVHVIGDGAARVALDCIAAARTANGPWPALHQLAHVQMIDPADIPRFRELGVVCNMQPLWARLEPSVEVTMPMVGPERAKWMYAWKSFVDSGAPYAVSSDWGVSTLNPFPIMQTAVTRKPEGKPDHPVFLPEQRIGVEDVVKGYTVNAAAGAWRDRDTGSLTAGKFADLIVLDRDIYAVEPEAIGETEVLLTML